MSWPGSFGRKELCPYFLLLLGLWNVETTSPFCEDTREHARATFFKKIEWGRGTISFLLFLHTLCFISSRPAHFSPSGTGLLTRSPRWKKNPFSRNEGKFFSIEFLPDSFLLFLTGEFFFLDTHTLRMASLISAVVDGYNSIWKLRGKWLLYYLKINLIIICIEIIQIQEWRTGFLWAHHCLHWQSAWRTWWSWKCGDRLTWRTGQPSSSATRWSFTTSFKSCLARGSSTRCVSFHLIPF